MVLQYPYKKLVKGCGNPNMQVGDHSDKRKLKLAGIAHAHSGMPAGDDDRDMKAPLLVTLLSAYLPG